MKIKMFVNDSEKHEEILKRIPTITVINNHTQLTGIYKEIDIDIEEEDLE